ncbi:hypothetical protein GIB67_038174 [Kingdonia uniflora]|uniref:Neprosin activation peptide domain-containing protein n=1 Tax=Kingdonia uniflora TaxID=39325 RepID=A0A7J7NH11_9MAGN|nr:hypothetical protein GIB67_038174 [Kingdonia uniflora]
MASTPNKISPIIPIFVLLLLVVLSMSVPAEADKVSLPVNQTFRPGEELQKLKRVRAHLRKINKPAVKTIQSPDGDLIDCVLSHLQPAFDHSLLQGQKPLDPPETAPEGLNSSSSVPETFQSWTVSGEFCPEGTIPIRRTTEDDLLRASSFRNLGEKYENKYDTTARAVDMGQYL